MKIFLQRRHPSADDQVTSRVKNQEKMMSSMLENALGRVTEAAGHLDVDPSILEKLKKPREMTQVRQTIRMDDGSSESLLAWRCRYDDTLGQTKGRTRFRPHVNANEVETLALLMPLAWMTDDPVGHVARATQRCAIFIAHSGLTH
ncbi:Glu/Leu/Phe/Val dehydrogenase dimerization domain-containing protein [Rhizobium leguminosarum]